jgi:hypothetical protein
MQATEHYARTWEIILKNVEWRSGAGGGKDGEWTKWEDEVANGDKGGKRKSFQRVTNISQNLTI